METKDRWLIGIGIGALVVNTLALAFSQRAFNRNLKTTATIAKINLARDLSREFYTGDPVYKQLRTAIESCQKPLYKRWGGKFDHDQINRYLGFFDDLEFYEKEGALDYSTIDQSFGAYIIEAYEYDDLRKYVEELQRDTKQSEALAGFQNLARELEKSPARTEMIEIARRGCTSSTSTPVGKNAQAREHQP
jgi:hypothetical protein